MTQVEQTILNRILPFVEKPGRYTGGELNQVVKDWDSIPVKIALVFPDIYDLGMSNLGMAILYEQINDRQDALAERVYAPWLDMEKELRAAGLPLYSLETKHALHAFDIVGISLPYETLYTNALNLLDLGGVPLRSAERGAQDPLVIAGGQAVYNPEPMHAFIDAFVIGEGEEIIHEVVDVWLSWKASGSSRNDLLAALAKIPGVYVPAFYEVRYDSDGMLTEVIPVKDSGAPLPVKKRIVAVLPPPPTRFVVPYIDVTHNRITVEIMRGCTRGCRFCHAGMVNRPIRERPVTQIMNAIQASLRHTGLEEVGLLSLSSSDYSQIKPLIREISRMQSSDWFNSQRLSISLPSMRIESFTEEFIDTLQDARRHGFTLAPEAASDALRTRINKAISDENLLNMVREIYARGFTTIKLYFMIGHPGETDDDVYAIADLCREALREGRRALGARAKVNVGISTFVPKPHTPFQWEPALETETVLIRQDILRRELRDRSIKLTWNNPHETILEACLSRGDRRLAEVIYTAWKNGAKFDAWGDQYRYTTWMEAFSACGLNVEDYIYRRRETGEILPWDHIHTGVSKKFLSRDYQWSMDGKTRQDCRDGCYACGISLAYTDVYRTTCQVITADTPAAEPEEG